ncbi:RNA chaperone Hfq [Halothermothrix orenii H 168]|uniref:RNA-binding protein Hfq n=2 Tax=Halothermothrix orenii TaxID=31909 RepID=B8CX91_HALOH|nr:RNA chaperone Hfq [Halothermothrix orenii]ACL69910.1 RNA chaperone Hfq [Halothermothrix orenii H 168]
MKNQFNLQDNLLNQVRKKNVPVVIYLVNGFQIKGKVTGFDNFTILINSEGKDQMVYKHAISTIIPQEKVDIQLSSE